MANLSVFLGFYGSNLDQQGKGVADGYRPGLAGPPQLANFTIRRPQLDAVKGDNGAG
jgi:hypothetical protein